MKKLRITQFVRFVTELEPEEFISQWEAFANECDIDADHKLLQVDSETKSRYKYISHHACYENEFRFAFMKGRNSEHFPEQKVKVIQSGGYIRLPAQKKYAEKNDDTSLIVFVDQKERDIDSYLQLSPAHPPHVYEAYYENCSYGYVLEFPAPELGPPDLLSLIQAKGNNESAIYRASLVSHA